MDIQTNGEYVFKSNSKNYKRQLSCIMLENKFVTFLWRTFIQRKSSVMIINNL